MRKRLTFCLPVVLLVGALGAPTGFAADKFYVEAIETFNPYSGIGWIESFPTISCPGHEPTLDPMQPCPAGSRTHSRGFVIVSQVDSTNPNMSGMMRVVLNGNMNAEFAGPVWGTYSILLDSGGTWEGTWQGLRVAEDGYWTAMLNVQGKGFGGDVDGMKFMGEDEILTFTPMPIAYFGWIKGHIVDPN